ncbi:ABC transporter ATP-binding protein [Arhodomonas sp. AD133]|uniref:ABC transporter ATP-binding protein n=1 Tax=Arhodomonas sp. AD133 TaxID=3415009 RepID=UPI003EBF1FB8
MIEVQSLSRRYGDITAVDDVSFSIDRGEVVGLLGHNGAGKTTIMKMLTGYLEPTAGGIRIDGLDMATQRREIQARIGYLPENCPVYPEMTVVDYLDYHAVLYGVPEADRPHAIRQSVERTALGEKALDRVATLSRGYRQRVGVAQAILHGPKVVILDEPTNGLDPSQIRDMRALIRRLAEHATVLVSTHILQEVQAVCDRVLMMRRGRLALDARLDELGDAPRLLVTLDGEPNRVTSVLGELAGVSQVDPLGPAHGHGHRYAVSADGDARELAPTLARRVQDEGMALYALEPEMRDLETVFTEINSVD